MESSPARLQARLMGGSWWSRYPVYAVAVGVALGFIGSLRLLPVCEHSFPTYCNALSIYILGSWVVALPMAWLYYTYQQSHWRDVEILESEVKRIVSPILI